MPIPQFKQKSGMVKQFSMVPDVKTERSVFNMKHSRKQTFDADKLVPFYVEEVLPGDTFNVNSTLFCRLMPLVAPIMDNLYLDTFYFFVPYRILWSNWKAFMGERLDPDTDVTDYVLPVLDAVTPTAESLYDYMGLPLATGLDNVSALPFRAYNAIYNHWFRDQNLIDSIPTNIGDGPDSVSDYVLRSRMKRHDYFTSCLPWPQKGDDIMVPLGSTAPVTGLGKATNQFLSGAVNDVRETDGDATTDYAAAAIIGGWSSSDYYLYMQEDPNHAGYPNIRADLAAATSATINEWRYAFQLQRFLERDARGGTRYHELVRSHFGVENPDSRMQVPEFLGGSSTPILVTPIAQQSASGLTGGTTKQGYLTGIGSAVSQRDGFTKSFTEHGIVIGILNVRADLTYQQGIARMYSRRTRYDFFWPSLAHIGEQTVLRKEIFANGTPADDDTVFGYQERYAEYKYHPSEICGKLRSTYSTPLDVWHVSQKFATYPQLDSTFIRSTTPMSRVLAVTTEPAFILDSLIENRAVRPMPLYSVPGMIDHF